MLVVFGSESQYRSYDVCDMACDFYVKAGKRVFQWEMHRLRIRVTILTATVMSPLIIIYLMTSNNYTIASYFSLTVS